MKTTTKTTDPEELRAQVRRHNETAQALLVSAEEHYRRARNAATRLQRVQNPRNQENR